MSVNDLNKYGTDGWELVAFVSHSSMSVSYATDYCYIFKRGYK